jgi:hypothetical protein
MYNSRVFVDACKLQGHGALLDVHYVPDHTHHLLIMRLLPQKMIWCWFSVGGCVE